MIYYSTAVQILTECVNEPILTEICHVPSGQLKLRENVHCTATTSVQ